MAVSNLTSRKISIELDEQDAVQLIKLLADLVGYIPSALRKDTPWLRISRAMSASFTSKSMRQRSRSWTDTKIS